MRMALQDGGLTPGQVGYINLHGTGTVLNDSMEARAVSRVFGSGVPCSSTKPLTGHTLGAAGATEAALCWLLLTQPGPVRVPAQLWDGEVDSALPPIRIVLEETVVESPYFQSNSFAFGGNNISLILGRADALR
jgi:3-oxoacyl-[acyl-carrier-protein] synthase-1